jgi:hypothetical protein
MDFVFLAGAGEVAKLPVLVMIATSFGSVFACVVRQKGPPDLVGVSAAVSWLQGIGLNSRIRLRSDSETSIMAYAQCIASRRQGYDPLAVTNLETAPVQSHGSIGAVDRYARTLGADVRTWCCAIFRRWNRTVTSQSAMYPWIVRHVAWVRDRFFQLQGKTAFERYTGRVYSGDLRQFGTVCLVRTPEATEQPKLLPRWIPGLYLGKTLKADTHIVGTENGVVISRSVKPLAQEAHAGGFDTMVWFPWRLNAGAAQLQGHVHEGEQAGDVRPPLTPMEEFLRLFGRTPGCAGCRESGQLHSDVCFRRFGNWQKEQAHPVEYPTERGSSSCAAAPPSATSESSSLRRQSTREAAQALAGPSSGAASSSSGPAESTTIPTGGGSRRGDAPSGREAVRRC